MYLYLRAFSIAIYQNFDLCFLCLFRLFTGHQIVQFWFVSKTILNLWPVLILETFSCCDIKKGQFQFLDYFLVVFFWSVNCSNQVSIYHPKNGKYFNLGFWFLVFQFLTFLSILSLVFLAIFHTLEMLKFWSVNYICQVCKLYFYFGNVQNF